jgi:hypothetical protein
VSTPRQFTIWINRMSDGTFGTHAWSGEGEATGTLQTSALPTHLRSVQPPGQLSRDLTRAAPLPEGREADALGDGLYRALFSGDVRDLLQRSRAAAEEHQQCLQLSLQVDPSDRQVAWLDGVEWELLHDDAEGFLALHPAWTMARYLLSPSSLKPLPFARPLRILVVIAKPAGLPPLALDAERLKVEAAWQASGSAEVVLVQPPTVHALSTQLMREKPFHIVHFMCHGTFDESSGKGYLLLEDDSREVNAVEGQVLAIHLQGRCPPSLVVLNACHSATGGPKPLSAVAASLVRRAGIPAVLAMKAPITDASAVAFSMELHEALAAGLSVDSAVTAARRALHARHPDRFDWAIPSLYLRAARSGVTEPPPVRQAASSSPQEREQRTRIDDTLDIGLLKAREATFTNVLKEGEAVDGFDIRAVSITNKTTIGTVDVDKFDRAGLIERAPREREPKPE